jgi:hypothetical protein
MRWIRLLPAGWKRLVWPPGLARVLLHATAIAAPAVALVWLGLGAFQRQRETLAQLTSANLVMGWRKASRGP